LTELRGGGDARRRNSERSAAHLVGKLGGSGARPGAGCTGRAREDPGAARGRREKSGRERAGGRPGCGGEGVEAR